MMMKPLLLPFLLRYSKRRVVLVPFFGIFVLTHSVMSTTYIRSGILVHLSSFNSAAAKAETWSELMYTVYLVLMYDT
jgi:hypothetical protein